jgi:hypothetical protein
LVRRSGYKIEMLMSGHSGERSTNLQARSQRRGPLLSIAIVRQSGDTTGAQGCQAWLSSERERLGSLTSGKASDFTTASTKGFATLEFSLAVMGLRSHSRFACTDKGAFSVQLNMMIDDYRASDSLLFDAILDSTEVVGPRADSAVLIPYSTKPRAFVLARPGFVVRDVFGFDESTTLSAQDEINGTKLAVEIGRLRDGGGSANPCRDSILQAGKKLAASSTVDSSALLSRDLGGKLVLQSLRVTGRAAMIQLACAVRDDFLVMLTASKSDAGPEDDARFSSIVEAMSFVDLVPPTSH